MDPLDLVLPRVQRCLEKNPVIVLGSGASVSFGIPGMSALKDHLVQAIKPDPVTADYSEWERVKASLGDLETALQREPVSESLLKSVIEATWDLINAADLKVLESLLVNPERLPLTRLYKFIFGSTHRKVTVVTTNYDRLAEYAADITGDYISSTGLSLGYIRFVDSSWGIQKDGRAARTVDVWKVHGSLDWFKRGDEMLRAIPLRTSLPTGLLPAIVTPGLKKYQLTYQEPFRTVIGHADHALEEAPGYLCLGYGFNDDHIHTKLRQRVMQGQAPLVILAKELTPAARELLEGIGSRDFVAFEESPQGTRAYSTEAPGGFDINGYSLWELGELMNVAIFGYRREKTDVAI